MDALAVTIRDARREDVPRMVELLADDGIGAGREDAGDLTPYEAAFDAIDADPRTELLVAELDGALIAILQLDLLPGLSRRGAWRAQLEAVRVASEFRSRGVGAQLVQAAVERARDRGAVLVQLTTSKPRVDAQRFYRRLGFEATHVGMKLML